MNWEKKEIIDGILRELEGNNKTINDIKYIINILGYNGISAQIYWVTWEEFISSKIKIKDFNTNDWKIVGNNWWLEMQIEGDPEYNYWNFRTKPKKPKYNYDKYYEEGK